MVQRRLGKIKTTSEDDLLKITRTESQGFEARPSQFDVDSVISDVISSLKNTAANKGCTIQFYSTATTKQIYTDRTLLVQTIEN